MNLIDIIIISVLCFFAIKGLFRGLVNEAASLTGLLAGGWLAYKFHPLLAVPIKSGLHLPVHIASFLAFIIILLATGICAHVIGNIITATLRLVMLGTLNRIGGILIGLTEGVLLLCLLLSIAVSGFMPERVRTTVTSSETANFLAMTGNQLLMEWRSSNGQIK